MNITMTNLSMTYPSGKKALQGLNADLKSPNLIGLVGPNGAGKSTLMKLLVTGLLPTGGSIAMDGKPLLSQERVLKSKLGYLPQSFGLYDELTVWQFLDYMAALKGIANARQAIDCALEDTSLKDKRKTRIRSLSGGQRQRVGIAQALLGNPEFLILDEPTVGLDPEERVRFRNLFSKAARGNIVLLSTHIIEDIQSVCNRVIVLHHGLMLFDGTPESLIQSAQGHVGIYEERPDFSLPEGARITARVHTPRGIACRVVAQALPDFATSAEPTLEDAYLFRVTKEAAAQ